MTKVNGKRTKYSMSYKTSYRALLGTSLKYILIGGLLIAALIGFLLEYRSSGDAHHTEIWLDTTISVGYNTLSLRDVLDSICSIKSCKWHVDGSRIVIETY